VNQLFRNPLAKEFLIVLRTDVPERNTATVDTSPTRGEGAPGAPRRGSSFLGWLYRRADDYRRSTNVKPESKIFSLIVIAFTLLCRACPARSIGIDTKTLLRWMKVPEFQTAYREARRQAFGQSIARLQQATGAAVSTLLKVMVDPGTPPSTKVRAADSVLDHAAKAIELEDIEVRVRALEEAAEKSGHGR